MSNDNWSHDNLTPTTDSQLFKMYIKILSLWVGVDLKSGLSVTYTRETNNNIFTLRFSNDQIKLQDVFTVYKYTW